MFFLILLLNVFFSSSAELKRGKGRATDQKKNNNNNNNNKNKKSASTYKWLSVGLLMCELYYCVSLNIYDLFSYTKAEFDASNFGISSWYLQYPEIIQKPSTFCVNHSTVRGLVVGRGFLCLVLDLVSSFQINSRKT